jgi:hypothetical protein
VSSIGVGCAEPIESVCDEIEVSGDNVEGAILFEIPDARGFGVYVGFMQCKTLAVFTELFLLSIASASVLWRYLISVHL